VHDRNLSGWSRFYVRPMRHDYTGCGKISEKLLQGLKTR